MKRKRGQPRKILDEKEIKFLASIWCTAEEIAGHLGCHRDTIYANYSDVLREGKEQGKASLKRLMWRAASSGNVNMQIWLSKQHLGYKDRQPEEIPSNNFHIHINEVP